MGRVCGSPYGAHWMGGLDTLVYLFNELNTSGQIHSEINEIPINTLSLILFLLQHKHVMIEKLLQLFICEINTQLLEAIELFVGIVEVYWITR